MSRHMNLLQTTLALGVFALGGAMQSAAQTGVTSTVRPVASRKGAMPGSSARTPAEQKIAAARGRLEKNQNDPSALSSLALALSQRARETADPAYYLQGEEAVAKALTIDPNNFEAARTRVWLLLGRHEFQEARELGLALNKRNPDDVMLYGFLGDACAELGLYDEAERHVQKMLDMRPPTVASLTRTAYLREIFGNLDGGLEAMAQAYRMTPMASTEDRAWILTQIGHLYLQRGNLAMARQLLEQANEAFPGYHYTLANLGKLAGMEGDWKQAAALFARRYEMAPHPENLFDLADAQERAGEPIAAEDTWKRFEKAALAESEGNDNANRELIAYYTRRADKHADAWVLAQKELERRSDVFTSIRATEALLVNGKVDDAWQTVNGVLKVGYRDAETLYLAGRIAGERGDDARRNELFAEAAAFNPKAEHAKLAMEKLLGGRSSAERRP